MLENFATESPIMQADVEQKIKELSNAYLVVGKDELKKKSTIDLMLNIFKSSTENADNISQIECSASSIHEAVMTSEAVPFFGDRKLVFLRNVDSVPASEMHEVVDYLKSPSETTVLIASATTLASNTKLYKAFAACGPKSIIKCDAPSPKELPSYVGKLASSYNIKVNSAAVSLLLDYLGEDTHLINSELNKLHLLVGDGGAVTADLIQDNVARVAEVKPWVVVDLFSERNAKGVFDAFRLLDDGAMFGLFAMLIKRVYNLIIVDSCVKSGRSSEIVAELKLSPKQAWLERKYKAWASKYTARELRRAISLAVDTEIKMKSGVGARRAVTDWLLKVM